MYMSNFEHEHSTDQFNRKINGCPLVVFLTSSDKGYGDIDYDLISDVELPREVAVFKVNNDEHKDKTYSACAQATLILIGVEDTPDYLSEFSAKFRI